MGMYQIIIEKILEEVDQDIKDIMMAETGIVNFSADRNYYGYELIENPASVILEWQKLRQMRKEDIQITSTYPGFNVGEIGLVNNKK